MATCPAAHGLLGPVSLLLLLLLRFSLSQQDACPLEPRTPGGYKRMDTSGCSYVRSDVKRNATKPAPDEIYLEVKNKTTGIIEVRFLLAPHNFTSYEVRLFIDETAKTPQECHKFKEKTSNSQRHSMQEFFNASCKNMAMHLADCAPTCNMQGSVQFHHVYTGCYVVSVTAKNLPDWFWNAVYSRPRMLYTKYSKDPVWLMMPLLGHQLHIPNEDDGRGNKDVTLLIRNFSSLLTERLPVDMYMRNGSCVFHDNDSNIASWSLALTDDNTLQCLKRKNLPFLQNCDLRENNTGIDCTILYLAPGNYCVGLDPVDPDQCNYKEGDVWRHMGNNHFNTCRYNYKLEVPEPNLDFPPEEPQSANEDATLIVAAAIIACITILVVVYATIRLWLKPVPDLALEPFPREVMPSQPRVLLLYAQDCREFMKLMTTFRRLLADLGKCEMLDCFDSDRLDVAPNPAEWMRRWASRPDMKVVLVASPCAVEHQKALEHNVSLLYLDPLPYNQLFRFGLKEVTHNQQRTYENTFVVKFDDKDLSYITPYTRYVLPLNLHELLKSLNPGIDIKNLNEHRSVKKLNTEHAHLLRCQRRNPDYILRLMARYQEVV